MNYTLNKDKNIDNLSSLKILLKLISDEKKGISISIIATIISCTMELLAPLMVGYAIDHYIKNQDIHGLLIFSGMLFGMYLVWMATGYVNNIAMGTVGRTVLFDLRKSLFDKFQALPISFFNQNKNGDLISRINNDTDKLNIFFSQSLIPAARSLFLVIGSILFLLYLNPWMGVVTIVPAIIIIIILVSIAPFTERLNRNKLKALGNLSSEIQESLSSFKVIVAFNRQDYFQRRFEEANKKNFEASIKAEMMNKAFIPLFDFAANMGQIAILFYGAYLVINGSITVGLLISYILYLTHFYDPLRNLANIWPSFQVAIAALGRISEVTDLEIGIRRVSGSNLKKGHYLEFNKVSFIYDNSDKKVIDSVSMVLDKGKTYAFVGPTGGGKTTIASLMSRLYDPTEGIVYLDGKDIRSYAKKDLSKKIGFILQDAILFSGSVKDNILYGNDLYVNTTDEEFIDLLKCDGLDILLDKFPEGVSTKICPHDNTMSLGEKQLIAFMRAVLRRPELLILDEATANIDTVTEDQLGMILNRLPKDIVKVVIAHRLNTIEGADKIFFVNSGRVVEAGSMQEAVDLLIREQRNS